MDKVQELKQKVLEAQQNSDIASLYVLEREAHEVFDEETLHAFYSNILDLALERLTNVLENHIVMDMSDVQDFATLRALYEYAIEHYSAGQPSDAAALFEVLSGLSNDNNFSQALKIHTAAASTSLSLEEFIDLIADVDATQNAGTFYISSFKKEAQDLLDKAQKDGE